MSKVWNIFKCYQRCRLSIAQLFECQTEQTLEIRDKLAENQNLKIIFHHSLTIYQFCLQSLIFLFVSACKVCISIPIKECRFRIYLLVQSQTMLNIFLECMCWWRLLAVGWRRINWYQCSCYSVEDVACTERDTFHCISDNF